MDAEDYTITPRRVIVVGGSKGIGAAIADRLCHEGHIVVTMQRHKEQGGVVLDLRWDIGRIQNAVNEAVSILGGVDWLVLSGGMGAYMRPLWGRKDVEGFEDQAVAQIQSNLLGPAFVFESASGHLVRNEDEEPSRVLLISSTVVRNPPKALAFYAASKAGIEAYFKSESRRWVGHGILINTLAVGWVDTPMTEGIADRLKEKILRAIALGRMASAEEIASAAMLCLQMPYAVGDVFTVSGGL